MLENFPDNSRHIQTNGVIPASELFQISSIGTPMVNLEEQERLALNSFLSIASWTLTEFEVKQQQILSITNWKLLLTEVEELNGKLKGENIGEDNRQCITLLHGYITFLKQQGSKRGLSPQVQQNEIGNLKTLLVTIYWNCYEWTQSSSTQENTNSPSVLLSDLFALYRSQFKPIETPTSWNIWKNANELWKDLKINLGSKSLGLMVSLEEESLAGNLLKELSLYVINYGRKYLHHSIRKRPPESRLNVLRNLYNAAIAVSSTRINNLQEVNLIKKINLECAHLSEGKLKTSLQGLVQTNGSFSVYNNSIPRVCDDNGANTFLPLLSKSEKKSNNHIKKITQLEKENKEKDLEIESLNQENNGFKQQLETNKATIELLEGNNSRLTTEVEALKKSSLLKDKKITTLEGKVNDLDNRLKASNETELRLEEKLNNLENENFQLKTDVRDQVNRNLILSERLDNLEERINNGFRQTQITQQPTSYSNVPSTLLYRQAGSGGGSNPIYPGYGTTQPNVNNITDGNASSNNFSNN